MDFQIGKSTSYKIRQIRFNIRLKKPFEAAYMECSDRDQIFCLQVKNIETNEISTCKVYAVTPDGKC